MNKRSASKILAIDIGNTSVLFGYYDRQQLKKTLRLSTKGIGLKEIRSLKKRFPIHELEAAIIASVVPPLGKQLKKKLRKDLGLSSYLIGKDIPIPIVNRTRSPRQVGIDRLMNAIAAFDRYHRSAIIIDFGTAITFDVVSKKGEYLGGVIAPGIEISLDALFRQTALLPKVRLAHPARWIGRDTVESIRIGCSIGIGGLCDRIIERIKKKYRLRPVIIATGGYAAFMARYCSAMDRIDPWLTLKGVRLTYQAASSCLRHLPAGRQVSGWGSGMPRALQQHLKKNA